MPRTKKQSPEKRRTLHRELMQARRTTVQGSFHQGSPLLPSQNRGTQCTCMSLIALVTAQKTSPANWTTADLDSILLEGDQLYSSYRHGRDFIMISELPQSVSHHGVQYALKYHNGYCGTLGRNSTEAPFYTLADAIIAAQRVSQHNFLLVGSEALSYTCMLINLGPQQGCFVFDSHSRNVHGMGAADGTSVLVTLPSVDQVANHVHQLSFSLQLTSADKFEVVPCSVHFTQQQREFYTPIDQYLKQQAEKQTQKRQQYQNKWLDKPGVKEQRRKREMINRSEPEVKRTRREREAIQRQQPKVKQARQMREATQRQQSEVKQARQMREAAQREQPEVKQARQIREAAQRQQPEVKQARQMREAAQRQQPEVKQARMMREAAQREQPEVKQSRQMRESAHRQQPEVKQARQIQEATQRELPEVKEARQMREAAQRQQPEVKQARQMREAAQREQPEVKQARQMREAAHRQQPEVKQARQMREAAQRQQPEVKQARQMQEAAQREQPEVKQARQMREKNQKQKPQVKERQKQKRALKQQAESEKLKDIDEVLHRFGKKICELPDYTCCVCERFRFRHQVQKYTSQKYQNHAEKLQVCQLSDEKKDQWICLACHNSLSKGRLPPLSTKGNNLKSINMPGDLKNLNTLEQFLLTPVLPFMKIICLPKGTQKGMHGPVVCVAANVPDTVSKLPRSIDDSGLLKVKLKRKLQYRGHHLYQQVRTNLVADAFQFLNQKHPSFRDIPRDRTIDISCQDDSAALITEPQLQSNKSEGEIESTDVTSLHPTTSTSMENQDDVVNEDEVNETSAPLVTCLQPTDLSQYISDTQEDDIFCVAPAEQNRPQSIQDKECEAFPLLFPEGKQTYADSRPVKLTISQYIKSRFFSADNKYAKNPEYLFYLQYLKEFNEVLSSARISLRKGSGYQSDVTVGELTSAASFRQMVHKNEGYKFLTKVRGSAPYWEKTLRDLCAMVKQLGIPTWFASFSAADRRWPEIASAILKVQGKETPVNMDWSEHCKIINSNPVVAAAMFDKRAHHLITELILSAAHPIGEVVDFFYRVEFQQRGWPHLHALFWVKEAPKLSTDNTSSDGDVVKFIDQYITCRIPDPTDQKMAEKVTNLQSHSKRHSKSCRKGNKQCRFNFPRPPSTRTFISRPIPCPEGVSPTLWKDEAKKQLEKLWDLISRDDSAALTAVELLHEAGLTQEQLEQALGRLATKVSVVLKREPKECWTNQYNKHLLDGWNANIDLQFVVNAYSCIAYILSYISKKESEEGALLKAAQKDAREGNEDAVKELRTIGQVYVTHREVSIMEAIWRGAGMKLKACSREIIWVPADEQSTRMTLPLSVLRNIAKQKGQDTTDVFQKSILDRYWARPNQAEFTYMCLADFVSQYRLVTGSRDDVDDRSDAEQDTESSTVILLENNAGAVTKRKTPAVIRYLKISKTKDSERHFSTLLRMYMPHRGKQMKRDNETYEQVFMTHDRVVLQNMDRYEHCTEEVDEAWSAVQQGDHLEDGWAEIAPGTEAERDDTELQQNNEFSDEEEVPQLPDLEAGLPSTSSSGRPTFLETTRQRVSSSQALCILQTMNKKQRELFLHLRQWCVDRVTGKTVKPFQVFVTGGAGTGKSHVINGFQYEANRLLSPLTDSADDVTVLLVAYTGTAAFHIGGQTIHSAFAIHSDIRSSKYTPLGDDQLTRLRSKYSKLQIVIIDEVSMVGHKMLMYIDQRLQQIKQSQSPFGNVSVLAVGDFYQIPPVGDRALYKIDSGRLCESPWTPFQLWELEEIMRQKSDLTFANLLNVIRSKPKSSTLHESERNLISSHIYQQHQVPDNILHIYPHNKDVDDFNNAQLDKCSGAITVHAADVTHSRGGSTKKRKSPAPKVHTMLQAIVRIANNARVMLTTNLDVADGLCNGVMGTVMYITSTKTNLEQPKCVWVLFDNNHVGVNSRQLSPPPTQLPAACVQIKPTTEQFTFQNVKITRHQYPLRLAWACTVHKTQGMTLQSCAVSCKGTFLAGMQYVAFSRVTNIDGLYITDYTEDALYCEPKVTAALESMTPLTVTATPLLSNPPSASSLVVTQHNIHSLAAHLKDMTSNPEMMCSNIICLCETWLKVTDMTNTFKIPGYIMLRNDRQDNSGRGGVAIYIQDSIKYRQILVPPGVLQPGVETLLVEMHDGTTIGVIYRSPTVPEVIFKDILSAILQTTSMTSKYILTGDFNKNISNHPELVQFEPLANFTQLITDSTYYVGNGSSSLLDHFYTRHCDILRSGVLHTYYSDHDPIYLEMSADDL